MLLKIIKECSIVGYVALTIVAAALAPSLVGRVMAQSPFTVDMTAVLKDWSGNPIKDAFQQTGDDIACAKCDDLTLGGAVVHALMLTLQADRDIDGAQRWAWGQIAQRVHEDKAAQLSGKEQTLIGDRILKVYANIPQGGVVMGAAMPLVDPNRKTELK